MAEPPCGHLDRVRDVRASAQGCEDCLAMGAHWVHLRICMTCGHVGCCDSSPNRHATEHWHAHENHPLVRSFEPGENWWWCFPDHMRFEVEGAAPAPSYER
ncbi:MAG: UBP-type zinc finger domain-containing protein [Dermatophilaceae bacterium]